VTLQTLAPQRGLGRVRGDCPRSWNGALPSAALNVVWMMIGVYALWRNRPAH
jgi:hypothetical protein